MFFDRDMASAAPEQKNGLTAISAIVMIKHSTALWYLRPKFRLPVEPQWRGCYTAPSPLEYQHANASSVPSQPAVTRIMDNLTTP
jgi:hypothetical protein